jgi:hypothetical protein
MTPKQKAQLRRKWRRWLKIIGYDLGWLLTSHDIFEEVQKIMKSNKKIQSPSLFYRWIKDNYSARVAIGIRRLVEPDKAYKRAISLYRLIEDISQNRQAITRDYCVSQWMQKGGLAERNFDIFANKGDPLISAYKLNRDMKSLQRETQRIRTFTNKYIAHYDLKGRIRRLPTFNDVDEVLKVVDAIFCKYYLLLTRDSMTTHKPVLQYDWKKPLRHAWISKQKKQ